MAVQEQTPLREYTANGVTTSFALGFDCEETNHLIVTIDNVEVLPTDWYLSGSNVIFWTAPGNGKLIKLQRNTPFNRLADYQSYNNSFRPPAINKEFDRIWWKLQELGVADWILSNRIDALKNYVDDRDDELRAYLMEEIRKQGVALDQLDEYYNYLMQRLAQIAVDKGWDSSFVVHKGKTQYEINEEQAEKNNLIDFKLSQMKSIWDFMTIPELVEEQRNTKAFNWSPIAQRAMDSDYLKIYVPAKKMMHEDPEPYYCDWTIFVRKEKIIVGDGANVSCFKLFDQCSIYHNPNRSEDRTNKGEGESLYKDYHAVMTSFTDNLELRYMGLDANVMGNFITVDDVVYNYGSLSNSAGVQRYCHGLVLESTAGGKTGDLWRIFGCRIQATSYTGILLNQTSYNKFKGRFEFESSHIKDTHEDTISIHMIEDFKIWNSRFGNSHTHLMHFYINAKKGDVHDNEFYLDNSYLNIKPQYSTEKFAFVFGHNSYNNTCEGVRVYNNRIENRYTLGELPNMNFCLASFARTCKDNYLEGNITKNLSYGVSFSGIPIGDNFIRNNYIEYNLFGMSFSFSGDINTNEISKAPFSPTVFYGGNTFKFIGSSAGGLSTNSDVRLTAAVPAAQAAYLDYIAVVDEGNNYDLGVYSNIASQKARLLATKKQYNYLETLADTTLLDGKHSYWQGRNGTNDGVTYTLINKFLSRHESVTGLNIVATDAEYPAIAGRSKNQFIKTGRYCLSFDLRQLNSNTTKVKLEQFNSAGSLVKTLLAETTIASTGDTKQFDFGVVVDTPSHGYFRLTFIGGAGANLNLQLFGSRLVDGSIRSLVQDPSDIDLVSSTIPTQVMPVGTIVKAKNPTTHLGWIYTTAGWKTYGAIT